MSMDLGKDRRFGEIAVQLQMVSSEKVERALVIQRCISNRTKVYMPIGSVLLKMGLLSEEQIDRVLAIQNGGAGDAEGETACPPVGGGTEDTDPLACIRLTVSADKLTASVEPVNHNVSPPPTAEIKKLLSAQGIVFGIADDALIADYLGNDPMPTAPYVLARGVAPIPGKPPEIRYYFDTDPTRIGTLLEDGSMDWKNRGEIPQVAEGDLLAEKVGGDPGKPGTDVYGQELLPSKVKEPSLKFTKGAGRSEDGRQVLAKNGGMPKLGADGRIGVFKVLPIDTDIGIETGNIDFEGHIEVSGGVASGYTVSGGSLSTKEVQNATIELLEDLVSYGGVYGSKVCVGGHLKASHLHNSTIEVLGDLVVENEIVGCTIDVNGRCVIENGKIIGSKISAKKGIDTKDIGTEAAKPSELIVGIDFKHERDMLACKTALEELDQNRSKAEADIATLRGRIDELDAELGAVAQEQDGCMVQKRQLEAKLSAPAVAGNPEKCSLLEELIRELAEKYDELDGKVHQIMSQDDLVRSKISALEKEIKSMEARTEETLNQISLLEEAARIDPGIPVVKASGVAYTKTSVAGPHKKIILPKDMKSVRIAESQEEPKQYTMKISSLR